MSLIHVDKVAKKYHSHEALKTFSVHVDEGEKLAIVGETGSGKSTLLKIIGGLLEPDEGFVLYAGSKILGPSDKLIPGHEDIIYLSQHFELPKFISVKDHLDNPYLIGKADAKKIYRSCQIEHLLEKDTRHLSGGEKQRVAIAKALTHLPSVILLDEPFSNLDSFHKETIKEVLHEIEVHSNTTIIMVAHEPKDVLPWADRIIVLQNGSVEQVGTPTEIYQSPHTTYVAGLFGKYNLIDPHKYGVQPDVSYPRIGDKVLVRPEQIVFALEEAQGLMCNIKIVEFHGTHYVVHVTTAYDTLIIESRDESYHIGDRLFIEFQ